MIQVGKPVKGTALIGREKEIREILLYLEMGQSVVLIAPRRFGKTSLVLEIINRLQKKKIYSGYIDIFSNASLKQLTRSIVEVVLENNGLKKLYITTRDSALAMIKSVKFKTVIEDFEFILGIEDEKIDAWTSFSQSIDFIDDFASMHRKKIIVAFDEYGDILKYDKSGEVIKMMRSKIQKQDSSTYIFSGSYESVMQSLFINSKSPFYRLAKIINLGYLEFDDLKKNMIKRLKKHNIEYDILLIEDILDFLKGHPYYSQLALQQMYLYHKLNNKAPTFDTLIEIIVNSDRSYLEQMWADLSTNMEYVYILKHLSIEPVGIYKMATKRKINASRTLKYLIGKGIIYKKEKGYYFYDPVFEFWIAKTINV